MTNLPNDGHTEDVPDELHWAELFAVIDPMFKGMSDHQRSEARALADDILAKVQHTTVLVGGYVGVCVLSGALISLRLREGSAKAQASLASISSALEDLIQTPWPPDSPAS